MGNGIAIMLGPKKVKISFSKDYVRAFLEYSKNKT
jgi:hypothetical protein